MLRKDGLILPDSAGVKLNVLITIGLTDDWRVGVAWPNDQLHRALVNRLTPAETQHLRDSIVNALVASMNKRLPAVISIG